MCICNYTLLDTYLYVVPSCRYVHYIRRRQDVLGWFAQPWREEQESNYGFLGWSVGCGWMPSTGLTGDIPTCTDNSETPLDGATGSLGAVAISRATHI